MDIKNKIALITGGASGLGEATVRHFVALGAKVAILDMNDELGTNIEQEFDGLVRYFNVDVTDAQSVENGVAGAMDAFGAVHILCNYAGISYPTKTIGKDGPGDYERFKKIIDVNLNGTFNVTRVVAFEMSKNQPLTDCGCRGVVVNTSSVAAYEGQIGQAAYTSSKAGVIGMTLTVARDLARNGIRVNSIVPGIIHTPLFETIPEDIYNSLVDQVLFPPRLGKPHEIAHTAQFLVENDYMNGECIRMDGAIRMTP